MDGTNKLVYVCDDDKNIRDLIRMYLESSDYDVEAFETGEALLKGLKNKVPNIITLDIMLPGKDGFTILENIRKTSDVPVILISAKDTEPDKVHGFNVGSDDYIVKPFMPLELMARIKNIIKRFENTNENKVVLQEETILNFSNIKIDVNKVEVYIGKNKVSLTKIEYAFLTYMIKNKDKALSKKDILKEVWGYSEDDQRVIDDLLKRFRKKLSDNNAKIEIETIWGVGYRLVDTSKKK